PEERRPGAIRARVLAEPERDDPTFEKDEPEREEPEEVVVERDHRSPQEQRRVRAAPELTERDALEQCDEKGADPRERSDDAADHAPQAIAASTDTSLPSDRDF